MFSIKHIIVLVLTLISSIFIFKYFKKNQEKDISDILKVLSVVFIFIDPIYWVWEIKHFYRFDWSTTMPLYLCSLFIFLLPIVAFSKKKGKLYRMSVSCLVSVGLFAATLGLIFNTHLNHWPFFSFVPMRSLTYHVLMIWSVVMILGSGYYKRQYSDYKLFFIPVLILMIPAIYLSIKFGWDYSFMNGGIGTPLHILSKKLGLSLYRIVFCLGLYFVNYFVYFFPIRTKKNENRISN
ncbi:MAG: hypothetical protein WBO70_04295 [Erysipelotrichaceae bacterium]